MYHYGTWDFGHTGVTIQTALNDMENDSKNLLWKPHWTCCGKGWSDECTKIHVHNGVPVNEFRSYEFKITDSSHQKYFKKKVRQQWKD